MLNYTCSICGRSFSTRRVYDPANTAICRFCKGKKTNLERYGVDNIFKKKDYIKECTIVKYGVDNVRKAPEIIQKMKEKRNSKTKEEKEAIIRKREESYKRIYGENYKEIFAEHHKQTCLERYGVANYMQSEEGQRKFEETSYKKYGTRRPTESQVLRKRISDKWRSFPKEKLQEIREAQSQKYNYQNIPFDSSVEIAFYIYCKDHNLNIQKCSKSFEYTYNNRKHLYIPDFEIDNQLYEIKGGQFLKEDNTWGNPFDHSLDALYEAKHQCALQNNVKIIYSGNCEKYLNYVDEKYGKGYIQQFRNKK